MANEKRLIYAGEIYELFYKQVEYGATDLMEAFEDALEDAQTVDAVEVDHAVLVSAQIALESIRQYRKIVGHDPVFEFCPKELNELADYARYLLGGNMDGGNEDE